MAKNLSHHDWVIQQFEEKYLKVSYRDVLIHSSIIEGTLRNESKQNKFDLANKSLLRDGGINSEEFCIFDEIRKIRNSLVHDSFKNQLVQNEIDKLRDNLMEKIHTAYRMSNFLEKKLFQKYEIDRTPIITFDPTN